MPIVGERRAAFIVLLFCFCLLGSMSGIAFASSGNWEEKGRLTGYAPKFGSSPLFIIETVDWRIRWEYEPIEEVPNLTAFSIHVQTHEDVNITDASDFFTESVEEETTSITVGSIIKSGTEETNGTLYINGYDRTFYLDIVSNAQSYTIIIEENLESIPEFPSWMILPLTITATLIAVVLKRKRL